MTGNIESEVTVSDQPFASTLNSTLTFAALLGNQPSTPTVSPSSHIEEEDEERKIERRLERLASCQSWAWHPDPYTGKEFSYQIRCGYWRETPNHEGCPFCLKDRKNKFQKRGELCKDYLRENLGILRMPDKEFKKLARKFRQQGVAYWRIPIQGGDVIVLFDASLHPGLSTLSYEDLNWLELCQTPLHRQYSGSLGYEREEKKIKSDDDIVVSFEQFAPSGLDRWEKKQCWDQAVKATNHLHPIFDVDKIQYAIYERMRVFEEFIIEAGGEVLHKSNKRVRMSKSLYQNWLYDDEREEPVELIPEIRSDPDLTYEQAVSELFLL